MIDLNLHELKDRLTLKREGEVVYIFCPIRKKYLVFQPEEMVRQLLIQYLMSSGYPKEKVQVEKGLDVNGLYRRFDIVVYDKSFQPFLLIECKAHTVFIDQSVFDQIAVYNYALKAPYFMVSNGVQTFCYQTNAVTKKRKSLQHIPPYTN